MKIVFNYNNKDFVHIIKNDIIKIYAVPEDYDEDGIYIADYTTTAIEPVPASDSEKTVLLYHADIRIVDDKIEQLAIYRHDVEVFYES